MEEEKIMMQLNRHMRRVKAKMTRTVMKLTRLRDEKSPHFDQRMRQRLCSAKAVLKNLIANPVTVTTQSVSVKT